MSWRIFTTATVDPDFAKLTAEQRARLSDDLFGWVEAGPPRQTMRRLLDAEVFEDVVPSGFRVTYFINESEPYVAIVRVRAV